jgi:hypothetical protein
MVPGVERMKAAGTKKPTEQFVMMPRALLESNAWRTLGINERRLLDFLMLEQMRHGGRKNGDLVAPHRQLVETGIGGRFIATAFQNLEARGLVRCQRHDAYSPNTYELTWLPCRGSPAVNDWRRFRGPAPVLHEGAARAGDTTDVKRCSTSASRRCSTGTKNGESRIVEFQGVARPVLHEGAALYRSSNQGGLDVSVESEGRAIAERAAALRVVRGGEP